MTLAVVQIEISKVQLTVAQNCCDTVASFEKDLD